MDDSTRNDGFTEIINLLAAPIASGFRGVEQMKRGVDEMWRAVENLNRTLENLNETATRVNSLLNDLEEPVRAMIPQLTRTIRTADEITQRLEAPVRNIAPNIERIVETLSAPGFASLPTQLGEVLSTIGDVSKRLGPLAMFAENAGGLFGGFRLPGMGAPSKPADQTPAPPPRSEASPEPAKPAAKRPAPKQRTAPKKRAAKRPAKQRATKR
jgi:hypothetical protein